MLRRSYLLPMLALLFATVALVPPFGDFPLNDDWVYAKMVRLLLDERRFVQHPYAAASGLIQTFWGAAFCAVFGYSFSVLRISTLVLALVAVWATARCARELGMARRTALLCGALLFANPLFLNLSYTFMSDVPFVALMMCSGWFYLRALRYGRNVDVLLGSVFAVVSFCNRQYGLLSTAAFAGALVVTMRGPLRRPRVGSVVALAGPWLAAGGLFAIFGLSFGLYFHRVGLAGDISRVKQIAFFLGFTFSFALYLGLFLLPPALGIAVQILTGAHRWRRPQWAWFLGLGGFFSLIVLVGARPMPYLPNMLRDFGVGPLTLSDSYFLHRGWSPVWLGVGVWRCIAAVGALAAGTLAAHGLGLLSKKSRAPTPGFGRRPLHPVRRAQYWFLFLWGGMLLFSPFNPALSVYFDRYMLPGIVPFLLLGASGLTARPYARLHWLMLATCGLLYVVSLASVQDYLAWNRARWDAIAELRSRYGARDEQIDGGYEFNGMYTSDTFRALHVDKPIHQMGEKDWWIIDNVYAVSFFPRDGYDVLDRVPYRTWLRREPLNVLILKRRN